MYFNGTKYLALLYCAFLSSSLVAKDAKPGVLPAGLHKPLCFVENKGQFTDENNHSRNDIQYKLSTPGMGLYVGNGQLHYQYNKIENASKGAYHLSTYRMDVKLAGANPNAAVIASEKQEYYENYYLSRTGANGITAHSYNKITYKDIYPGIDWVVYIKNNKVEYDFVVRPGGDISKIKLEYDGATALEMTHEGNLLTKTPMGDITANRPYAYETSSGKAVASEFVLNGNTVSFKTGPYSGPLTIDPYLSWSTYFGGTAEDVVTSVKETTGGSTFAGGYSASSTYVLTGGIHTHYLNGAYDAFLAKYNSATGAMVFATYLGGTNSDQATAIAIDNTGAGNPAVYIAGYTTSTVFTGALPVKAYAGGSDGFLVKLTNAGALSWYTFYGGTGDDYVYAVTCDAANSPIIVGQTASGAGIASSTSVYQPALSGATDAFIAKLNSTSGAVTWSTYYGGSSDDEALGVVTDPSDSIYITGQTNSITSIASATAFQSSLNGFNDAFIAKFDPLGNRDWGTYFGGPGTEQGNGIAYDPIYNNIAIVGNTSSTSGVASANAYQSVSGGGGQDAFLSYFDTSGAQLWSTYYGGPSLDYGQGVCFDPIGNLIITGGTFSASGIASPVGTFAATAYQSAIGGDYDAYIAKLDPLGQSLWGTYFGGTLYDYANSVFCDNSYHITIGGFTTSTGLYGAGGLATSSAPQTVNNGGTYDGFISKFNPDTLVAIKQIYKDTLVCDGGALTVPYILNLDFQPDNVFTVQLSDITGSFASPVNIGSVSSNTIGSVTCTIPAATTPGTGYRIRITSSNPVYISPDDYYNITVVTTLPPSTATGSTPSCIGNTIYLYDTSTSYAISNYNWTGPNGFSSALQDPTIPGAVAASAGVYTVSATHNGCPADTSTVTIVVNDSYPPQPSDSASSPTCAGNTLYLFANTDTTATGITFYWSGPDGFTSTAQNPTLASLTSANSGTYTLTDSLAGCPSASNSIVVDVIPTTPASVSISATPGDTICAGTLVSFSAIPDNGGTTPRYQWMSGISSPIVGAISSTFSSSSLLNGETIFCVMSSSLVCPSPVQASSNVITMNVIDNPPVVGIYATTGTIVPPGTNVTFISIVYDAGVAPLYQWQLNGVNIPGATNPTLMLTTTNNNDTISLMVTSTMNCAVPNYDVTSIVIVPTTGIAGIASPFDNIGLFPNPNDGSFTIKGDMQGINAGTVSFEIMDPLGRLVNTGDITLQNNSLNRSIDLGNVANGIYLIRMHSGSESKVFRFTVAH